MKEILLATFLVSSFFLLQAVEVFPDGSNVVDDADEEDPRCLQWAEVNECTNNPAWMLANCIKACQRFGAMVPAAPVGWQYDADATTTLTAQAGVELAPVLEKKLGTLLEGTFTHQCRDQVYNAMMDHTKALLEEKSFPFESTHFRSQCPSKDKNAKLLASKRYGPPKSASEIRICYLLLIHDQPDQAKRLIEALQEPRHSFVVHVDGKAGPALREDLAQYAGREGFYADGAASGSLSNIHVLGDDLRVNITWGGFNMVRATLNGLEYAYRTPGLRNFDWLINLSGATYPLKPNAMIVEKLASLPTNATTFMEVNPTPTEPAPNTWHYFVECDNRLRRIWQLARPNGISMYTGSQWFIASKPFVEWIIEDKKFVPQYAEYGKHTVVADENFFATLIKNSPFCELHTNTNLVHVQFDQWEHDKLGHRNQINAEKCLFPNKNHCGRSPTINTVEYLPALQLGDKLFARKFDREVDSRVIVAIEHMRSTGSYAQGLEFKGVRMVHRRDGKDLCIDLAGRDGAAARLVECNSTDTQQELDVGPCSPEGNLTLTPSSLESGPHLPAVVHRGTWSQPYCQFNFGHNKCLDLEGESVKMGTSIIGWPCGPAKWNQVRS